MAFFVVTEDVSYEDQEITGKHFGVNLVTIFDEEFVDPDDELAGNVQELGATSLRFPGGSATENYFDMRQPDLAVSARNPSQTLTPMDQFFARAGEIGTSVTIVVPTQMAFSESAAQAMLSGTYGVRQDVTATYLQDVAAFVATAVAYAEVNGVRIEAFEIGNEFWGSGEMTAGEYGIVAGEVAALLQSELDALGVSGAEIIAQTTSSASQLYSSRNAVEAYVGEVDGVLRAFSQSDINSEFDGVVPEGWQSVTLSGQGSARSQVSQIANGINSVPGAAEAIDGIVQHYYQSGGFDRADGTKSFKFSQFQRLEDQLNRSPESPELTYHITEWNTNATGASNNRGLQNASMMIENFFELVANDVDVAQIWPLSFDAAQGISLVDLDGPGLAISGEMFRLMSESLPDSRPVLDWSVSGVIDVHGFERSTGAVFFISERSGARQSGVELDVSQFLDADEYFMTATQIWDGGAGGDDSTAAPVLTDTSGMISGTQTLAFDLDSWANMRIEVTYVGDGNNTLTGRGGDDQITGWGGADYIDGGAGADILDGGTGNDHLIGGLGDDRLKGGAGDDVVDGGEGYDIAEFADALTSYMIKFGSGAENGSSFELTGSSGETDTLFGIEVLSFSDQSLSVDRIAAYLEEAYGNLSDQASQGFLVSLEEIAAAPDPTAPPQVQMEIGRTSIHQVDSTYWQSVTFSERISDAAVIMGPASSQGGQPFTVRVRDVTETGFQFQIDEWDYLDGVHKSLDISWLAGSLGTHDLVDGSTIQFGALETTSLTNDNMELAGFDAAPIVVGQLAGDAEASSITHRLDDVSSEGFDFLVQFEEANAPLRSAVAQSTFYYAALEASSDGFIFATGSQSTNHRYREIGETLEDHESFFAEMQSIEGMDPGVLRYHMADSGEVSLKYKEEKSLDRESRHIDEDVAWFFADQGIYEFV